MAEKKTFDLATAFPSLAPLVPVVQNLRKQLSQRVLLLEFGAGHLLAADLSLGFRGMQLHGLWLSPLPEGVTEQGVPVEPAEMAPLLEEAVQELGSGAQRAAVVLPPQACFSQPLLLPADQAPEQRHAEVLKAGSGVQLPFPLQKADFDLMANGPVGADGRQPHWLLAAPQTRLERLVNCVSAAGLELWRVDHSPLAQLRLLQPRLEQLAEGHSLLLLDLLPGQSHGMLVNRWGPQRALLLAPVRAFPEFDAAVHEAPPPPPGTLVYPLGLDDTYFPLTDVDLLPLARDLRKLEQQLARAAEPSALVEVVLSGPGSAHPGVEELLGEQLPFAVQLLRCRDLAAFHPLQPPRSFNAQCLNRVAGLALGVAELSPASR